MQSTLNEEAQAAELTEQKKCLTCGSDNILPGFPNALCSDCRQSYIQFPFPKWIKAFGIGIGVVVIFSLFSFFGNLATGIHMERGMRAEKEHRYFTAQREFEQVLKKVPTHLEATAHVLISAYYNQDLEALTKAAALLQGKTFDNQELYEQTDHTMSLGSAFFPSDSLNALYTTFTDTTAAVRTALVDAYYKKNPTDISAGLKVASDALYQPDYAKADSVLEKIIANDPENRPALTLMMTVKRYEKNAAGALKYADQLLDVNKEDLYALSSRARIMVMMNKDDEALKQAEKVDKLDGSFGYNQATLAIVYHYSNKIKERDMIISKAKANKDSSVMEYMQYAIDIINNKEKLRS